MTIAIIGLGLIGGSLALNFSATHTVWGWDDDNETVDYCLKKGIIHKAKRVSELKGADVVFVCVPIFAVAETVDKVYKAVGESAIITDVGSVKRSLSESKGRIVGGHPMSGTEFCGIRAAKFDLFKNNYYFLVKYSATRDDDVQTVQNLITELGSRVIYTDAENHDKIVARLSHLPHMAAYSLSQSALCNDTDFVAGSGFISTTRIACSDARFWSEVARLNADNLSACLQGYIDELNSVKAFIDSGNFEELNAYLEKAKHKRENLTKA